MWGSSTTPNTLEAIVGKEQKPLKCKRRSKPAACLKSEFGCCADNKTAATGPFDEGCQVSETCKDTKFGCCPDGVSPAKGKKNKGCPKALCHSSLFGCCKDGKTEAEGSNLEGCPIEVTTTTTTTTTQAPKKAESTTGGVTSQTELDTTAEPTPAPTTVANPRCENQTDCAPCNNEPFGCCRDGDTPAHGPNGEGCCLDSPFGCCLDNITPARGPNLEECGCQYSPYGCCPDNTTSARGYDNDGCGCQHQKHGCCPDKVTAAKGPKFEGCGCEHYQFGCCADGVTIAQGPHNYGCHCLQREHKCCSDGITPATGPNFEGCTCATSKYGCCPDGVTDAQGSQFEGCTEIPVEPQKACSLTKDGGTCSNYTVKYFFDLEYGGCSRFWYSGCDGNDNRYDSVEECKSTCEAPTGKDACLLPKIHGPCTGYYPVYYYDSDRNTCSQFIYGGCLGNTNRFETIEECQKLCQVDESLRKLGRAPILHYWKFIENFFFHFPSSAPCEQPVEAGKCHGQFERWAYDKEQDTCTRFAYTGCKGNKNHFASEEACSYQCKRPGARKGKWRVIREFAWVCCDFASGVCSFWCAVLPGFGFVNAINGNGFFIFNIFGFVFWSGL